MRNNYPWLTGSIILALFLGFTSFIVYLFLNNYDFSVCVFPFTYIQSIFSSSISFISILAGFLQFALYGYLLDTFKKRKQRLLIAALLLVMHTALVITIFLYKNPELQFPAA